MILGVTFHPMYKKTCFLLDKPPTFIYDDAADSRCALVATDYETGLMSRYIFQQSGPSFKAFAGREFDIPLVSGNSIHASGDWWYGGFPSTSHKEISYLTLDEVRKNGNKSLLFCAHMESHKFLTAFNTYKFIEWTDVLLM